MIIKDETKEEYEKKRGKYLTFHGLQNFIYSPYKYSFLQKNPGAESITPQRRQAYLEGDAAHLWTLEGIKAFKKEFGVGGPVNPNNGKVYGSDTQKFKAWVEEQKQDKFLSTEVYEKLREMVASVKRHKVARKLLNKLKGNPEVTIRFEDFYGVCSQSRVDWLSYNIKDPRKSYIVDFKTCRDLAAFEANAHEYQYVYQGAYYREMVSFAYGYQVKRIPVYFIAVEKQPPYLCGVWEVRTEIMDYAWEEMKKHIRNLIHCEMNNKWPTGFDGIRVLE